MASIYKISSGWRAQVRLKDKPAVSKIFRTKNEAVIWARSQEEALHKTSSKNPHLMYRELYSEYARMSRPGGRTKQHVMARLLEYWGEWRMTEIGTRAVSDYAATRARDGVGPATILQELSYLGTAIEHGAVLCENEEAMRARAAVTATIKSLRVMGVVDDPEERTRRPTEDELMRLEEWFHDRPRSSVPMMDIVLFAICTTMRLGEILGITWEDYDQKSRTIWIRNRKDPTTQTGRDDRVPLLVGPVTYRGNVVDPCELISKANSAFRSRGRVFPYGKSTISQAFGVAVVGMKIPDLRFHDLRHDGISRLFEAGYRIEQVAVVSGHRSWKNLKRYTHINPVTLHR
jgi:integrase